MSEKCTRPVNRDQQVKPPSAVSNKIFVSKLEVDHTEEQIRTLFSSFGEVDHVVVDGYSAIVAFKDEKVVNELEEMGEITLNSSKLFMARVLEEHPKTGDEESPTPFYLPGVPVAPTPYQPTIQGMNTTYSSYQPPFPYPVWYPSSSSMALPNYETPVPSYGPAIQSSSPGAAVPPYPPVNSSAREQSVFSFDSLSTQLPSHQKYQPSHSRGSTTGCCHVCTTHSTVQGVAPLPPQHQVQYPGEATTGHQLQPLTPITPSLQTGYLLPPTPTPINLPPMTPTFYMPPTPAPSHMFYNYQGYTSPPPGTTQSNCFTHLKAESGLVNEENKPSMHMQNMAYFTSPFKRFTKFQGTPSPGGFPLKHTSSKVRGQGDSSSNWYKQGERWGHRSRGELDQVRSGDGVVPDIVKDC